MSTIHNKKIVAKEYPLKDILSNNKYSIDYFQREYRWQKENIDQLIDDLYSAFRADYRPEHSTKDVANYASYFMGSIVVIAKDDATMSIIDGQQREIWQGFVADGLFITAAHILKVYVAPCILVNGRTYALSKEPSLFVSYFED